MIKIAIDELYDDPFPTIFIDDTVHFKKSSGSFPCSPNILKQNDRP